MNIIYKKIMNKKLGFILFCFLFLSNNAVFSVKINWETTDRQEIARQWADVFWLKKHVPEENIDELVYIAEETIKNKKAEQEYRQRPLTFPVNVIFPGNAIIKCSEEEFYSIEKRLVPTPTDNTFVLVDSSWFGFWPPKSILGCEANYSASGDCVMNPKKDYNYRKSSWALNEIDYESLGFIAFEPQAEIGWLGTSRLIWMAPHHYNYSMNTLRIRLKYQHLLFQRHQELACP